MYIWKQLVYNLLRKLGITKLTKKMLLRSCRIYCDDLFSLNYRSK